MGKVFGTSAIALVCIRILAYYACAVEACSCMRVLEKNLRESCKISIVLIFCSNIVKYQNPLMLFSCNSKIRD